MNGSLKQIIETEYGVGNRNLNFRDLSVIFVYLEEQNGDLLCYYLCNVITKC